MTEQEKQQMIEERAKSVYEENYNKSFDLATPSQKQLYIDHATPEYEYWEKRFLSHQPKPTEELREKQFRERIKDHLIDEFANFMVGQNSVCGYYGLLAKDKKKWRAKSELYFSWFEEHTPTYFIYINQPKIDWEGIKKHCPHMSRGAKNTLQSEWLKHEGYIEGVEACKKAVEGK